jgi:NDP-sugar pyrophosphorylase family protein
LRAVSIQRKNLTAFILAGGMGTRLQTVVNDRPKSLAEINGRPFLYYQLEYLRRSGISSVVLCTGYMADAIEQAMGTEHHNMPIHYSREDSPLGTGGAIRNALPLAHSDPVLVINGDTLVDTELSVFIDRSTEESAAASLLLLPVGDVSRFGSVEIDGAGNITAFREKSESTAANGWVNAGIYLLTQDFISSIPDDQPVSIEREVFPAQTGNGLYGFQATGSFIDIGTPESYRLAEPFLKRLAQREDD